MSTERIKTDTKDGTLDGFNGNQDLGENQPWGNKKSVQVWQTFFPSSASGLVSFTISRRLFVGTIQIPHRVPYHTTDLSVSLESRVHII